MTYRRHSDISLCSSLRVRAGARIERGSTNCSISISRATSGPRLVLVFPILDETEETRRSGLTVPRLECRSRRSPSIRKRPDQLEPAIN